MPYEKEEDKQSEVKYRLGRGGGMIDYHIASTAISLPKNFLPLPYSQ